MIDNFEFMISDVIILGSGNVAEHLVRAFLKTDIKVRQIFSKNIVSGKALSGIANCSFTNIISDVINSADLYVFAMNDAANTEISQKLIIDKDRILVHTAGSLSMNIFKNRTKNYGVLYPFQTFSKEISLDFSTVPVCIEASNEETLNVLKELSSSLNCKHYEINESKRSILHLSGVFVSNFMNHCVYLGNEILKNADIDTEIIKPLQDQSFYKISNFSAFESQTGPALRNDKISMQKHLEFLENDKNLYDIYRLLSQSIYKTYNGPDES